MQEDKPSEAPQATAVSPTYTERHPFSMTHCSPHLQWNPKGMQHLTNELCRIEAVVSPVGAAPTVAHHRKV